MSLALSKNEQVFAAALAKATGLNPDVVAAWVRNEEPAANATVGQNDQNWLNIGNVDSGGRSHANVWGNPETAAQATAAWMKGQPSVSGYGVASPGIQSILKAGGNPEAEIRAIQGSGWASGGETALPGLYSSASGQKITMPAGYTPSAASGTTAAVGNPKPTGTSPIPSTVAAPSGPKGSDLLSLFGTEDAQSNPSQSATWSALSSLMKSKGQ